MKKIEIGIIGGTGGIGCWFADFFQREGYAVHVTGRKTGLSIPALAEKCAVVIVSVPIDATAEIIRDVGPRLKRESLLMDFTSLKEEPVREMLASTKAEVVGCHPLFGPDVPSLSGQNIVVCPARGKRWFLWLVDILEKNDARIVEATPQRHDRMMAVIQGLVHINTISLGLTIRESGVEPSELERFSTPVFRAKMHFIDKVFHRSPGLYAEIIARNPNIPEIIDIYEKKISALKKIIARKDANSLMNLLK